MPGTEFASVEPLRIVLCFALTFAVAPSIADPPPGYYATADTTSSTTLRQTVHAIIDDHTRFPYTASAPFESCLVSRLRADSEGLEQSAGS